MSVCSTHFMARMLLVACVTSAVSSSSPVSDLDRQRAQENALAGWNAFEDGQFERALSLLSRAVALQPKQPDYHEALGQVYSKLRQPERALDEFKQAMAAKPDSREFRFRLASFYQTQDRDLDALKVLDCSEPVGRLQGPWIFSVGFSLFRVGRYGDAEREFRRLLQDPRLGGPANFFLGNVMFAQNRFADALPYYRTAAEEGNRPDNRTYNAYTYNYGLTLYQLGRYSDAASQFQRSIERFAKDPLPWLWLGRSEQQLGDYPAAIAALERSIQVDPDFRPTYFQLARLQQQHGDKKRAAELFAKVSAIKQEELARDEKAAEKAKTTGPGANDAISSQKPR